MTSDVYSLLLGTYLDFINQQIVSKTRLIKKKFGTFPSTFKAENTCIVVKKVQTQGKLGNISIKKLTY